MSNSPDERRLNPFAFPAETDVRFNLFVAVALALTAAMGFTFTVLLIRFGFLDVPLFAPGEPLPDLILSSGREVRWAIFYEVLGEVWTWLALPVGLTLAVLGLSSLLYRLHPRYVRRGRSLQPVIAARNPELLHTIVELTHHAGLNSPPAVEIEPKLMIPYDGQIFGFKGGYALRIDGLTPATMKKAPARFRAFILHELAHITNRDISRYYFALALWSAVMLLVLFPLVGSGLLRLVFWQQTTPFPGAVNDWPYFFYEIVPRIALILVQAGIITIVVIAIFQSLTWVRELYADWRTALWGVEAPLVEIIRSKMDGVAVKQNGWRNRIPLAPARHPAGQQRIATLQQPRHLFIIKNDLPFFVGFLIAFLIVGVLQIGPHLLLAVRALVEVVYFYTMGVLTSWLSQLGPAKIIFNGVDQIALILPTFVTIISFFLGMGALIAGTVGLQVQRQTLALMASGKRQSYWGLWRPAFMLALGIQIGFLVIPANPLASISYTWRSFIFHFLLAPLWIIGFSGLVWLWLSYARFFAKRILGAYCAIKPPVWPRRRLTLVLGVLLWVLLIPGVLGQYLLADYAYDPATWVDPTVRTLPWSLFYFSLPVSLFLFLLIFGISFVLLWLSRTTRRITCSACGAVTSHSYAVGQTCERCGQPLAPWLFVTSTLIPKINT